MDRAISVVDFETPLDAVKAGLHRGDIAILSDFGLYQRRYMRLPDMKVGLQTCHLLVQPCELALNGLQVLENQFVCHIFTHGRTIAAARDPRKFNPPFRRAFSPKHSSAQPARRRRMPAGRS